MPDCRSPQLPSHLFALSSERLVGAASNGTLFVTFTNAEVSDFAVNWARLLQQLGLRSLIGVSSRLPRADERSEANETYPDIGLRAS